MEIRIFSKLIIIFGTLGAISAIINVFDSGSMYGTITLVGLTSLFVGLHRIVISQQTKVEGTHNGDKIIGVLGMIMGIVLIGSMIIKISLVR